MKKYILIFLLSFCVQTLALADVWNTTSYSTVDNITILVYTYTWENINGGGASYTTGVAYGLPQDNTKYNGNVFLHGSVTTSSYHEGNFGYGETSSEQTSYPTFVVKGTFYNSPELLSVSVPSNVTCLGGGSFQLCSELNKLIILSSTPETATEDIVSDYDYTKLYVPQGCKKAYQEADYWKKFTHIIEIGSEQSVEVTLSEPGTLEKKLAENDITTITSLKISGPINCADVITIRTKMPTLISLDLTDATITTDHSQTYYTDKDNTCYLDKDILGDFMLQGLKLETLILPKNLIALGNKAVADCVNLKSISIPNGVNAIKNNTFENCIQLTSIGLPAGLSSIGNYAFANCNKLSSIELPSGLIGIGGGAFSNCSALTSINLPNTIKNIGNFAFEYCTGISQFNLPNTITEIGAYAFRGCEKLSIINIPSSIQRLEKYIFEDCSSLTELEIPANIKSVDANAFANCKALKSIFIKNSNLVLASEELCDTETYTNCTLYVPSELKATYQANTFWSKFNSIVGATTTGIQNTSSPISLKIMKKLYFSLDGKQLEKPNNSQILIEKIIYNNSSSFTRTIYTK